MTHTNSSAGPTDAALEQPSTVRVARTLVVAVVAGLVGELLIHATLFDSAPTGLGRTLFLLVLIAVLLAGKWLVGSPPSGWAIGLLITAAFFAAMLSVRGSPVLSACNLIAAISLMLLAVFVYREGRVTDLSITDYVQVLAGGMRGGIEQPLRLARSDVSDMRERLVTSFARSKSIIRSVAIALILLLVFGALLVSADAVFANLLDSILGFEVGGWVLLGAGLVVLATAWLLIGLLRYSVARGPLMEFDRAFGFLARTETIILLAPLVGLFAVFVVIQFTYLFGGVDTILATGGLTRAEYYRQGFFQLVAVAALVTLLVLAVDWAHRPRGSRVDKPVAVLFGSLVVLTGVMVVSALLRLKLYVDSFGLTELRVYTIAFVIWVGLCLILLLATVIRGARRYFAVGALVAGLTVGAGLNLVNPDGLIARVNVEHHINTGTELDTNYLRYFLSTDAVPTIIDLLPEIPDPCVRSSATEAAYRDLDAQGGWRSYHWGRSRAQTAITNLDPATQDCDP